MGNENMSEERINELFWRLMDWVWEHLEYFDRKDCIYSLKNIGFSDAEIRELTKDWEEK